MEALGTGLIVALAIGAVILFLFMYGVGVYNSLVRLRNRLENAFSQIEVQLKRRYDLIPNLVETVKGYMKHERETLEAVITARNQAAMHELAGAEAALSGTLGRLFALSEAYPDLKANQNMAQLTEELTATENKVAFARQAYNDSVMQYNTYRQSFPPVFFANFLGHSEDAELLEFADREQIAVAPKVAF